MRLPIAKLAPALVALTFALTASAEVPKIQSSKVSFTAAGPAGLKIEGTGNKVTVEKSGDKIKFVSSVKNMKTGMDLRDKHLNDHLKVPPEGEKTASLTVSESAVEGAKKAGATGTVKGDFSMNGATKPVTVSYETKTEDGKLAVTGKFTIIISDYIKKPCYLGVCVDDQIKIAVKLYPKKD